MFIIYSFFDTLEIRVNQIEKRSWVEINLSQIRHNLFVYKSKLKKDAQIMAVIKADAYGHGDVQVARMLSECGISMFAVSNIDEAIVLRKSGIKGDILILGYTSPYYSKTIVENDLTQALVSDEYAEILVKTKLPIKCQFAIDTGMNRIGLDGDNPERCEMIIRKYYGSKLCVNGMFTHLCVADDFNDSSRRFTYDQIEKFKSLVDRITDLDLPFVHCCNSAGGLYYLDDTLLFERIGNIVRLGIMLYGLRPDADCILPQGIAPALTWKSAISMVKEVHAGETIGYGRSFTVAKDSKIATVTTGYADGLNRNLSNRGFVLINGQKAPIVGKICMDQTLVDVTNIPNVKMGDKVTILGKSGNIEYTADDMANDTGTIGYEVVCDINKRVQRFYVNSNINL